MKQDSWPLNKMFHITIFTNEGRGGKTCATYMFVVDTSNLITIEQCEVNLAYNTHPLVVYSI